VSFAMESNIMKGLLALVVVLASCATVDTSRRDDAYSNAAQAHDAARGCARKQGAEDPHCRALADRANVLTAEAQREQANLEATAPTPGESGAHVGQAVAEGMRAAGESLQPPSPTAPRPTTTCTTRTVGNTAHTECR
jgi:hypothetical protein